MSRFALTLLLDRGKNDAHHHLVRVLNPDLVVRGPRDCPLTRLAEEFFAAQSGVRVERQTVQSQRAAEHETYPQVLVTLDGAPFHVPLPALSGDVPGSTLKTRLARHFCRKPLSLREHQKDLVKALAARNFAERNAPAFMLMWEMGSGKTLGALSLLLDRRSAHNVVVCGNTNIDYWADALRRADPPTAPDPEAERNVALRFDVVGYTAFRADYDSQRAMRRISCVVVDEAHYFRNNTQGMQFAMQCVRSAKNVLLLTGTPIVNDVEDVEGMLDLIDMDGAFALRDRPSPARVAELLRGHVSWFDPSVHRPLMFQRHYPSVAEETVRVPMTASQTLEYLMALKSTFEFGPFTVQQGRTNRYNALTRGVCNAPSDDPASSPKLRAVAANILRLRERGPQVVHSSLVETGVKPLLAMLQACEPPLTVDIITGETETRARDGIRCRYNQGRLDVLLISDASQQGTDLMGTSAMHLVEPFPNTSLRMQTRARVIRMGSHRKAAFDQVLCFYYVSVFPPGITPADAVEATAYARRHHILGTQTDSLLPQVDMRQELLRQIRDQQNQTVNERQVVTNDLKQRQIDPYLDAFRRATVPMSTQKGTKLYLSDDQANGDDQADEPVAAKRKADGKPKAGKTVGGKTVGGKTSGGKTGSGKTSGGKTGSGKTSGGKTSGGKTGDMTNGKTGGKTGGKKAVADRKTTPGSTARAPGGAPKGRFAAKMPPIAENAGDDDTVSMLSALPPALVDVPGKVRRFTYNLSSELKPARS